MKLIGITSENLLLNECKLIETALDCGLDYIHIRKPSLSESELSELLSAVSPRYYNRVVIHDHFNLALKFPIGGVHLNRRSPLPPIGYSGRVSKSCHSIDELYFNSELAYCTLSPIFDAISKINYRSNFTQNELENGQKSGLLGEKTIALGGICPENIAIIAQIGFGGVAVLGYLWREPTIEGVTKQVGLLTNEIVKFY